MLPFFQDDLIHDFEEARLPTRTCQVDFGRNIARGFSLDGLEAIKQAIFLKLNIERYEYSIYSWNFGSELQSLIGTPAPLVYVKIRNAISDALLSDDRIFRVHDFKFQRDGARVCVTFKVDTEEGLAEMEMMVRVQHG